jgi:DNA-binding MarR family transcriptional regulator
MPTTSNRHSIQRDVSARLAERYHQEYDWSDSRAVEACLRSDLASSTHKSAIRHRVQELGMESNTGYPVLRALYFSPGHSMSQGEISNHIQITSASITYLVDVLEREGLVRRTVDASNRRAKMISLTGPGVETCRRVIPAIAQLMNRALAGFSEDEKVMFVDFLDRFWRNSEAEFGVTTPVDEAAG